MMSRHAIAARALLTALRDLGDGDQAASFEGRFAKLGWILGPEDVAALSQALQRAVADGDAPEPEPPQPLGVAPSALRDPAHRVVQTATAKPAVPM
jgi:hypothetical protein